MLKFRRYEQKILKYRNKLKKFVIRVGIYSHDDFELVDNKLRKLILPCHLGILFCGVFDKALTVEIKSALNKVYDSFFYDILDLGQYNFSKDLFSKGVKKEYKEMVKKSGKLGIHPTNKFYKVLIDKRNEENLDIIIGLTDLPIYSSNDDTILFLFGETHLEHRCCVISSLKLKEQFYNRQSNLILFYKRMIKEVIHEVGHLILGPEHCTKSLCVMRSSKYIEEIDDKSLDFCDNCKVKLRRIRERSNF
ncbi:MAG: hypothetical protein ACXAEX_16880 [Promethearchaeota archaeon]|jgi:predicted Zn-dependent protease